MKCACAGEKSQNERSLPVRGAWVEISRATPDRKKERSLPVRGAWVEIPSAIGRASRRASLPVRGAWVEITIGMKNVVIAPVAPRAGSVG